MKPKGLNVVFVGGGSPRVLPVVRAAMASQQVFEGGSIRLVDKIVPRAEAVGEMIRRCPEFQQVNCRVSWGQDLDRALDGADVLYVTMAVGRPATVLRSRDASMKRGFLSSDNLSLSGAFLALTAGPAILGFARRMERLCPDAILLDFANPVAVYSGMVNNHTRIRALGICGGFTNHRWDLTRLIFGMDETRDIYDVDVAGINHLSFILRGTCEGRDLFELMSRRLRQPFTPPRYQPWFRPGARRHVNFALRRLEEMYHRFGTVIFSTEGDGMTHLYYERMFAMQKKDWRPASEAAIRKHARRAESERAESDARFRAYLSQPLDDAFWRQPYYVNERISTHPDEISVTLLRALAGLGQAKVAASAPSRGAVAGFPARSVLEFSQIVDRRGPRPAGSFAVPPPFHGLIAALSTHQTLLGDAIATQDPRLLADALFAYPVHFNTRAARQTCLDLLAIHREEIPAVFQEAAPWIRKVK